MSSPENKSRSNPFRMVAHMLAALVNSRSEFQTQWRRYERLPERPEGISGRWIGQWLSQLSGHHGELKCVLEKNSATHYKAYFYGRYSKLFSVGYVTSLHAEETNGRVRLKGEEDLGALAGGIYSCEGEATENEFECRYSCKYDRGVFRLKRVP